MRTIFMRMVVLVGLAGTLGLSGVAVSTLHAHEKGVLHPATRELVPGDTLTVRGEKFTARSRLGLVLVGAAGRWDLATVRTDSIGAFSLSVAVPAAVSPGSYRLVAVAADGDQVAGVDVVVTADEKMEHAGMSHDAAGGSPGGPSAEPLPLHRARSGAVNLGAVAFILLAAALGIGLLRRRGIAEV